MSSKKHGCVVVTGTSSGIGLAIAQNLLAQGISVIGLARNPAVPALDQANYFPLAIDLSRIDELEHKLKRELAAIESRIDAAITALICNAGFARMAYLEQLAVRDMTQIMNSNFMGHAILTKYLLATLKRQQGDIIFMGSEASLQGGQQGSLYSASKFALRGFAQSLRQECSKSGLRITLINPGAVRTPFFDELGFEPGPEEENAIVAEDIAQTVNMVLTARPGTVFDEINLSPLKQVWQKK